MLLKKFPSYGIISVFILFSCQLYAQELYREGDGFVKIKYASVKSIYKTIWIVSGTDSTLKAIVKLKPFFLEEHEQWAVYSIASEKYIHAKNNTESNLQVNDSVMNVFIMTSRKDTRKPLSGNTALQAHWHIDTVTVNSDDTIKRPPGKSFKELQRNAIKVNALKIITEGFYTDEPYLNQGLQNAYLRTTLVSNVTALGLPFNISALISTENNSGLNQLNNFRLGFDQAAFKENIKKKIEQESAYDKLAEEKAKQLLKEKLEKLSEENNIGLPDTALSIKGKTKTGYPDVNTILSYTNNLSYHLNDIDGKLLRMNTKLSDSAYIKDMRLQSGVLEEGDRNPSMKNSSRYRTARRKKDDDDQLRKDYEYYSKLKNALNQYSQILKMEKVKERGEMPGMENYKGVKKGGFKNAYYKRLLAINRLDIGTFNAAYSSLVIDGVSLMGLNVEYNERNFYAAFMGGFNNVNFNNPFQANIAGRRNVIAGRLGYGNLNKALFVITLLKGTDLEKNVVGDANYTYYQPNDNYVLGAQLKYTIIKGLYLELEYARSLSVNRFPEEGKANFSDAMSGLLKKDVPYANSYSGKVNYLSSSGRTRVSFLCRQVDPMYFSFGAPLLRNDNFRTETKLDQKLYKNILSGSVALKYDRDNLYGFKTGTSKIFSTTYTLNARFKNGLQLTGIYSPIRQSYYTTLLNRTIVSDLHLASLIANYTHIYKNIMSVSTVALNRFWNNSVGTPAEDTLSAKISQYTLSFNEVLNFRKQEASIMYNMSYCKQGRQGDSSDMFMSTLSGNYKVFRKKLEVSNGVTLQQDLHVQSRYILFTTLDLMVARFLRINVGYDFQIIRYLISNDQTYGNVFRMKAIIIVK